MSILKEMKKRTLIFEGAMGSLLQARGLPAGKDSESWNLERPEEIVRVHLEYLNAGADIIKCNTFGVNGLHYRAGGGSGSLEEMLDAAFGNAREALRLFRERSGISEADRPIYLALDLGPSGRLLKPFGDLEFEEAVEAFSASLRHASKYADLVLIETMNDCLETKAAVLAAKESCELPIFVSNTYDASQKLMTGADPETMAAMLEGLRVDAIGINCGLGPEEALPVIRRLLAASSLPVFANPNAGMPRISEGKTLYDVDPESFAALMATALREGLSMAGGCCGTTPEHIRALSEAVRAREAESSNAAGSETRKEAAGRTAVSSFAKCVEFGTRPVLIGERLNPTGKKLLKQALKDGDMSYILKMAIEQEEAGCELLDVNCGLPEIDEEKLLPKIVRELQGITSLPLSIDTTNARALEAALRIYCGKALINSVSGKKESMAEVFPLAAKYGAALVCLTLDEEGIPDSAEGRLEIAERIRLEAEKYGIEKKDLIIDPLCLSLATDKNAARVTLKALRLLGEAGYKTSLGVSNVSFGLPKREVLNSAFFTAALREGLSAAIMNPLSAPMMGAYHAELLMSGQDEAAGEYIEYAEGLPEEAIAKTPKGSSPKSGRVETEKSAAGLSYAVEKGLSAEAAEEASSALREGREPLDLIDSEIIPALDRMGKAFENGAAYLPQLLMSAEAAKAAFDVIKRELKALPSGGKSRGKVVIATVKNDIHDIGKNIVKVLLENYGFDVLDLGKDVPKEEILSAAREQRVRLVGLSALMTTTVPSMQETIKLLKRWDPDCSVVVGGAVLNEDYARMIEADKYARDAMETVRYAEKLLSPGSPE